MTRSRPPGPTSLLAWTALLSAQLAVLVAAGSVLPGPPGVHPASVSAWLHEQGPVAAALGVARLGALAGCAYLLLTVGLGLVVRLTRVPTLLAVAELVTVPRIRRLLYGGVGVGLSLAATTATIPTTAMAAPSPLAAQPAPPAPPSHPVTMRSVPEESGTATSTTSKPSPPPVMRTLDPDADQARPAAHHPPTAPVPPDPPPAASTPPASEPVGRAREASSWTVAPGEHLWGIAHHTLATAWARPPTDEETATYLDVLIATNEERLPVPGNPDLIFPGQVFELPPVGPPLTGA
ncbi:hypothetical protein [Rhabdothermincola sediminis]|uniref:hypothetical protein n=1 Tax=Rhabdothermincola sediminis TaxID=2751370 RepID=UPI001AA06627|nr:hypothetical protein [Rhabdothermincola sediminis]